MYVRGIAGLAQDSAKAVLAFNSGCELGDGLSCGALAEALAKGLGVDQDDARSTSLYTKACSLGQAGSCSVAGLRFEGGVGVRADAARALELYERGCALGGDGVPACLSVAMAISTPSRPPRPEALKRAAELLARACDGNVVEACTELGFRYSRGIGVAADQKKSAPVDSTKAMAAFAKACTLGSGESCELLKTQCAKGVTEACTTFR